MLAYYTFACSHKKLSGKSGQLLDETVLYVLWALDPNSFFLTYPRDGVLVRVDNVPEPFALPAWNLLPEALGRVSVSILWTRALDFNVNITE